jgi:nucleoside-diphosphate-sugar epimerase
LSRGDSEGFSDGWCRLYGWPLVEALVKAGQQVRILDTLSTASIKNLADALGAMEFVKGGYREVFSKYARLSKLGLGVRE